MAFKYACFISYSHGQGELVKSFIEQLKAALKNEIETLLDEQVYIDEERMKPGFKYNEELANAICASVCMVVVYSPVYERHEYCLREYEAMARLEEKRRAILGDAAGSEGFIIPVIFRGEDDIPARIKDFTHYVDFSKFSLVTSELARHPDYEKDIRRIAKVITDHYKAFSRRGLDPCEPCKNFHLPAPGEVQPWRPNGDAPPWPPTFVNR